MLEIETIHELSQNEARVLYSLCKWPSAADNEIHGRINMKKSTYSSIKNRLKDHGYYTKVFVPNFPMLGYELMMVLFGHLNRFSTFEERDRIAGDVLRSFSEDFLQVNEDTKTFHLSIAQNFSEYSKNMDKFYRIYTENRFLAKNGLKRIAYPFEISRIKSFLDYESLLAKIFGFASDPYEKRKTLATGKVKVVKLTKAQKKVLVGLINHPDETDTLIADSVGVSRNTVANAKKKFLEKGILLPKFVPNIEKLGMKQIVFTYRRFNPKVTPQLREETTELVRRKLAPFFYVSKNLDSVMISAHTSDDEFEEAHQELMAHYEKHEYLLEEPTLLKISISDMHTTRHYDFIDLITKKLEFNSRIAEDQVTSLDDA